MRFKWGNGVYWMIKGIEGWGVVKEVVVVWGEVWMKVNYYVEGLRVGDFEMGGNDGG